MSDCGCGFPLAWHLTPKDLLLTCERADYSAFITREGHLVQGDQTDSSHALMLHRAGLADLAKHEASAEFSGDYMEMIVESLREHEMVRISPWQRELNVHTAGRVNADQQRVIVELTTRAKREAWRVRFEAS